MTVIILIAGLFSLFSLYQFVSHIIRFHFFSIKFCTEKVWEKE